MHQKMDWDGRDDKGSWRLQKQLRTLDADAAKRDPGHVMCIWLVNKRFRETIGKKML